METANFMSSEPEPEPEPKRSRLEISIHSVKNIINAFISSGVVLPKI